jgi:uncharacterized protein (DUF952 family)
MIYHITNARAVAEIIKSGQYYPEGFLMDGFVHCSTQSQVISVANRYYQGQKGLVILAIIEDKLQSKVVFENLEGGIELFPHVYSSIPKTAIKEAAYLPLIDGKFLFPREWVSLIELSNMVK